MKSFCRERQKNEGGGAITKGKTTKGWLVKKFELERSGKMPEVGTKVREGGDDIVVGTEYVITNVEDVVTDVKAYNGVRVLLQASDKSEGNVMLWKRPVTTPRSKLGAFITLLGSNTDKWVAKKILFKDWREGARLIELVK